MAVNHVREWRGYRTERMLKVQMVKFAGPGFTSMSSESRKKGEKRTMEAECALGFHSPLLAFFSTF